MTAGARCLKIELNSRAAGELFPSTYMIIKNYLYTQRKIDHR